MASAGLRRVALVTGNCVCVCFSLYHHLVWTMVAMLLLRTVSLGWLARCSLISSRTCRIVAAKLGAIERNLEIVIKWLENRLSYGCMTDRKGGENGQMVVWPVEIGTNTMIIIDCKALSVVFPFLVSHLLWNLSCRWKWSTAETRLGATRKQKR